ncbi:MAG TPA: 4-hydroxythreonine-4-phosphate dehydrogenase PdxA [Pyrinomonadaceae bacterium]|nr:4-hydroxythreonine-4-phosphate dehydrogenase PdxA [Pyrinomonadaceae bacterium]
MSTTSIEPLIDKRPRIGITIGDAAGIGPEIVLKSISETALRQKLRPIVIGDGGVLRSTAEFLGLGVDLSEVGRASGDSVDLVDMKNLEGPVRFGEESAETGRASGEYIEKAVELWTNGEIDAIATAPISKKALNAGGFDYPGHTEFLADLTRTPEFAMSFFAGELRVILLSTHLSLIDAIARVTKDNLVKLIQFSDRQLTELLKRRVRIAVAGLNPHASENGMFGGEEAEHIIPAIEYCRDGLRIDVTGPYAPDTIFLRGHRGEFDAVIALYHDQATIAVKSLSFGSAVNVTIGLPLIRTSVDHGTALDIAGKGIADASSMTAAIELAGELANLNARSASSR